eukprot:TRINITY_DN4455_c0_g1_i1.p2 TRINITY_DN4455_c0_g1~~TRINITY_DN4455_c0_g1_i1.p2  ORF type:complete len:81 (+),score=16.08 TRINITY_DN4455_c0_g1_i1:468-710(+)
MRLHSRHNDGVYKLLDWAGILKAEQLRTRRSFGENLRRDMQRKRFWKDCVVVAVCYIISIVVLIFGYHWNSEKRDVPPNW